MAYSNAILYKMYSGFPGTPSRDAFQVTMESYMYDQTNTFIAFGLPGKLSSTGTFVPITTGDTSDKVIGFLTKPWPITSMNTSAPLTSPFGSVTPNSYGSCDVLRRGYMTVACQNGTPAVGQRVAVRVNNGTTSTPIGGIECATPSSYNYTLTAGGTDTTTSITSVSIANSPPVGEYRGIMNSSSTFTLFAPEGRRYGTGTVGTPFSSDISFTLTSTANTLVKGDEFVVEVTQANPTNTIIIPYAYFTGTKDANNNVEIAYNI